MVDITGDGIEDLDLTGTGSLLTRNGAIFTDAVNVGSGTGGYNTFLAISDDNDDGESERGFNSDDTNPLDGSNDEIDHSKTHTVRVSDLVIVTVNGVQYYEFRVDLNESNSTPNTQISLDQFKIYTSGSGAIQDTTTLFGQSLRYDMDQGGDVSVLLSEANSSGSGTDDYAVLVPVSNFAGAASSDFIYLFVEMGKAGVGWEAAGGFEEWNLQNAVTLIGTKFEDENNNGIRDAGEDGVGGVTIFIDSNTNGVLDAGERSTVTAADGTYTFLGVGTGVTLQIDEVVPAGATQTTGAFETVTIPANAAPGSTIVVDPIGNFIPRPDITIIKSVRDVNGDTTDPVVTAANQIVTYLISITNTGNITLTGENVSDSIVALVTKVDEDEDGFNDGDLNFNNLFDPGEEFLFTAQYTVTQADIDSNGGGDGDLDNIATVTTNQTGPENDDAVVPIVQNPAIAIDKVFVNVTGGDGDALADAVGDVLNYTVRVTNTGNVTLTGVTVVDPLTGQNISGVTLAPGAFNDYATSYTLTQADLDKAGNAGADGDIDNTATADSNETGSVNDSAEVPLVYNPAIAIDKVFVNVTGGDGDALADAVGDILNYTVRVTNTGNVTLTGVTVVDPLTGQNISGVTLAPGAFNDYATSYTLTQADLDKAGNAGADGDIDNTATADSNETGSVNDSAEVPLVYNPAIAIDKVFVNVTGGDGDALADAVGDILNYTVRVTNTGNVTLTGVTVVDPLTGQNISGVTLAPGAFNDYATSYTLTQADLDKAGNAGADGDIDNTATADSNETGSVNDSAEVPLVYNPAIAIDKVFVNVTGGDGDALADAVGDILNYTVRVTNTGNVTLTGVTVVDPLTGQNISGVTLAPGAFNDYATSYTLTQADLDKAGNAGADGDIDNTATADSNETGSVNDSAEVPLVYNPAIAIDKVFVNVTGGDGDALADAVGDILNYTVRVTNTGNVTLTGVTVVDPLTGQNISGVTLAPGAFNDYATSYTLTQADLDKAGNAGADGDIDNTATADSNETGSVNDSAEVPLVYNPAIAIDKVFVNVTGGDGDALADAVGDVLNYTVRVTNTGNVTLTGVTVVDPLTGQNISGVTLAPGAFNDYATSYTLTQADLDKAGNAGADGDIDNTATADSNETGSVNDSAEVPLVYNPLVDLEKLVSVNSTDGTDGTFVDADTALLGPENVNIGTDVWFKVTLANTGNVTLTDVDVVDNNTTTGLPGTFFDLVVDGALTLDAINNFGATLVGDSDSDGDLDVGETWTITYNQAFDPGNHVNTATITTDEGATDNDAAHYFSLINEGPGVRTPGFWQNMNNGGQFWDGIVGNEKNAGQDCFADGELLYDIYLTDTNGDGFVDNLDAASKGLLIGDYNTNGVSDAGEDTLFVSYTDARLLINASNKQVGGDGRFMLGRDMVATWLNSLAGNNIGDAADPESPKHYLDDAIDWMQIFSGTNNPPPPANLTETFDTFKMAGNAIKTSSAAWNGPVTGIDHTASQMHGALDQYNNTGQTEVGGTFYAHDCDDEAFVQALHVINSPDYLL